MAASDNAVIIDDKNTETRTDAPDETEFKTVMPTVFIINPGPEFTLYEISLRTDAESVAPLSNSCFISLTPTGYPPMNEKITAHMHVWGTFKAFAHTAAALPEENAPSLYAVSDSTANRKREGITVSRHMEIPRSAPRIAYEGLSVTAAAISRITAVLNMFFVLLILITDTLLCPRVIINENQAYIFFGGTLMSREKKKKRGGEITRALADELQMPVNQVANDFHIEFFGRNQILTEGCLGVLEYDSGRIRLNLNGAVITYEGEGLEISSYDDDRIEIKGGVVNISFS